MATDTVHSPYKTQGPRWFMEEGDSGKRWVCPRRPWKGVPQDTFLTEAWPHSLPSLLSPFSPGSKPEYLRMECGAQGGLWSGEPDLPPHSFLTPLTKNIMWSHTGQGRPPQSHRPCA